MPRKRSPEVAEAKLSDAALADHFWECHDAGEEVSRPAINDGAEKFKAYGGSFLSEANKDHLAKTERPPVEVNLVAIKVNTVLGTQLSDRQEVTFRPDSADKAAMVMADWRTQLVRKAMNGCDGHRQQTDVLFDGLCMGYGHAEVYLDTSRFPHKPVLREVPPGELIFDPEAKEDCLGDETFKIRKKKWLVEEVIATWPGKADEIKRAAQMYLQAGASSSKARATRNLLRSRVEVAEFLYKRWIPRVRWYDPELDLQRDTLPSILEARRKELAKQVDELGTPLYEPIEEESFRGETFYRSFLLLGERGKDKSGSPTDVVLEHEESSIHGFSILSYTCLKLKDPVKNRTRFFGPVGILEQLQKIFNRLVQEHLSYLARAVKGGGFYNKDAVPEGMTQEEWLRELSKPGMFTPTSGDPGTLVQLNPPPQSPTGLVDMERSIADWMGQTTGLTEALAGTMTQERSNVLINNLQNRAIIALGPVLDPLTLFIKRCGYALCQLMVRHLPVADLDRLLGNPQVEGMTYTLGEDGEEQIPVTGEDGTPVTAGVLLKQENPLDFEISVDVGKAQVWAQAAVWELFQQGVLQTMQNAGVPMELLAPMLLRNLPLPGTEAKELAESVEKDMAEKKRMQTEEGVREFLLGLPPEQGFALIQGVAEELQALLPEGEAGVEELNEEGVEMGGEGMPPEGMPPEGMPMEPPPGMPPEGMPPF